MSRSLIEKRISKLESIVDEDLIGITGIEFERLEDFYQQLLILNKQYSRELSAFKLKTEFSKLISNVEMILI